MTLESVGKRLVLRHHQYALYDAKAVEPHVFRNTLILAHLLNSYVGEIESRFKPNFSTCTVIHAGAPSAGFFFKFCSPEKCWKLSMSPQ